MFTPPVIALLLAIPSPCCTLPLATQPGALSIRQHKPLVAWIGKDSARTEKGTLLVSTQEDWDRLWSQHRGDPALDDSARPWIDFDEITVLALFGGRTSQCRGEGIHTIEELEDCVRIRCWSMSYSIGLGPGADLEELTRPVNSFGIFLLPRFDKPIVIERWFYDHKLAPGEPEPAWTEVARFDPPARGSPPGDK